MAKQAVKKTAEALIFRFVGMGRGALGLLNRFGGSLSGAQKKLEEYLETLRKVLGD